MKIKVTKGTIALSLRWVLGSVAGTMLAVSCIPILSHQFARATPSPSSPRISVERFLPGFSRELPRRDILLRGATPNRLSLLVCLRDRNLPFSARLEAARQLALTGAPGNKRIIFDVFFSETIAHQRALARTLALADLPGFQAALIKAIESGTDTEAASAIRALAVAGGEENHARLNEIMTDPAWPEHLRREAAQALLQTNNELLMRQAIQGMATIGSEQETTSLAAILHDAGSQQSLRMQAAIGLGHIASPRAGDELITAFNEFADDDAQAILLGALGRFPFSQIADTWKSFLDDPSTPDGLRAVAAEALANSSREAVPLLASLASADRSADVREMAAWALSTQETGGGLGRQIAQMIRSESEPDVRRRLYESLLVQSENPVESVFPVVTQEEDPAARVAALNAVGDAVGRNPHGPMASAFDTRMVPELEAVALGASSLNLRMRAVFALRRAGTPASKTALTVISQTPTPEIATAALHGLQASR